MSRLLICGMIFCGESYRATLELPDKYFDENGRPLMHLLNSRLAAHPTITWTTPINGCEKVGAPLANGRAATDQHNYYREKFTELLQMNPQKAEEIQAMPIATIEKIDLLEKELKQ